MIKFLGLLAGAAVAFLSLGSPALADQAAQLYPVDLQVDDDEGGWFPENVFHLSWDRPPVTDEGFPITAVDFRVRDATGAVVIAQTRLLGDRTAIQHIRVPLLPGIYTADVWLEGPGGAPGPVVSVPLRFDDVAPGAARPHPPAGWIAGDAPVVVTIEHPAGPQPVSGIRGYAVAVDRHGERGPCAAPSRCSIAETDLRGGVDDDTIALGTLPEGASVVSAVAVSGAGISSAEISRAVVRVDATRPETTLFGAPDGWANGPVRLTARSTDSLSGMRASGPAGAYTAIAVNGGTPKTESGETVAATVTGEGRHSVAFYARDAAGNGGGRSPSAATVAIDETPPRVAFARAQDAAEPERIEATVVDSLAGADPERGSIAVRPAGTSRRWLSLPAVARAGRLVAYWDSESYPAAAYEFRASGYDVAGNVATSNRRSNGVKMVLVNPVKSPLQLQAGFGGGRLPGKPCTRSAERRRCPRTTASRTVPYGRGASYGGRLTSAAGVPLRNLSVQIVESFDAGATLSRRSTTVLTGADGGFLTRLRPGPNRRVEAIFAGSQTLGRASGGEAQLRTLAGLRMGISAAVARIGGAPVIFRGRVGRLGAPLPPGGVPVELQFRVPGRDWAEFRTVQTDARGQFRYPYAFSDDDSRGVRFQFRAYMSGGGWPYEPAASSSVSVTGR